MYEGRVYLVYIYLTMYAIINFDDNVWRLLCYF